MLLVQFRYHFLTVFLGPAEKGIRRRLNPEASSIECLSLNALAAKVEEWIPDAEGAGEDGGFAEAVAADIRPAAALEFDKAQAAIFLAGAEVSPFSRPSIPRHTRQGRAMQSSKRHTQCFALSIVEMMFLTST